jgi:hypothetical protein
MDINEMYELMKFIIRKNQNGNLRPTDFNLTINVASVSYMDYLLGEFQKYIPGRPFAAVDFGQNQDIRQRLSPFIPAPVTLTIDVNGQSPYPTNYLNSDAMTYGAYRQRVKFIQQDRLFSHLNSYVDPIALNPIHLIYKDGFQFYPTNLGTAYLSYIRKPATMFWNSALDIYNRPVYNPVGSVQPEWQELDQLEIIVRALAQVGVSLQARDVQQYSQMIKTQGQ